MCKETNTIWKAEVDLVERMELQRQGCFRRQEEHAIQGILLTDQVAKAQLRCVCGGGGCMCVKGSLDQVGAQSV